MAQARCVLTGIAALIDRLKAENIYDQTAFIISGDHGHNTVPVDQVAHPLNYGMYEPLLGTGRPALLVKQKGAKGPLLFSDIPTELLNIMPTALQLTGLNHDGESVFDVPQTLERPRIFRHYPIAPFWSGDPVPYLEYEILQPTNDASLWKLSNIVGVDSAPMKYDPVNKKTSKAFVYGARLSNTIGKNRSSWIQGRQLAFLIDVPEGTKGGLLEIELAFAPWIREQAFTVELNGEAIWQSRATGVSAAGGEWRIFRIPLPRAELRTGPEFVSVLFDRTYENPGSPGQRAAARVRSIRYLDH